MNLHRLELFLAIADTGSFSRAAEIMRLTQSTVSQHIAALEEELGLRLFDRSGRGVKLTDGGRLLAQHAGRISTECTELRQAMAGFRGLAAGSLKVGASNIPATYLLPELLPELASRYPGILLNVSAGDSREIVALLAEGELALAVVGTRYEERVISYTPLTGDTLQLVVGAGHPWRGRAGVELAELTALPLILREAGSGSGRTVEEALRAAGLDPGGLAVMARLGSNEAIKQAVGRGAGAAFLSSLSIRRELAHGELAVVTVRGLSIERRFWLATRRGRSLSPAAQAFSTLLTEKFTNKTAAC